MTLKALGRDIIVEWPLYSVVVGGAALFTRCLSRCVRHRAVVLPHGSRSQLRNKTMIWHYWRRRNGRWIWNYWRRRDGNWTWKSMLSVPCSTPPGGGGVVFRNLPQFYRNFTAIFQ